jgi:hypothetical protein
MSIWVNDRELRENSRGQLTLSAPFDTDLGVTPDTYTPILGTFSNGINNDYSLAANGELTYTGLTSQAFSFNGVSDLETDKASKITYALFLNGVLVPGAETPHDFSASSKTENISITSLAMIQPNDVIRIYAKSDTASTTITVQTLRVTLWGA